MRIPTTLAAAGAVLALCAPASAATKVVTTYDATFSGAGSYDRTDSMVSGGGRQTIQESALFEFSSVASLRFVNGKLEGEVHTPTTINGSANRHDTIVTPSSTFSASCNGDSPTQPQDGLAYDPHPAGPESRLEWFAYDRLTIPMSCDAGLGGGTLDFNLDGDFNSIIGSFEIPPAAMDAGQVIQLFKLDPDTPCPGRGAMTTKCAFEWSGQIRLTKTGTEIIDDAKPATPAPAPSPVVAPVIPSYTGSAAALIDEIKAQLQPGKALVSVACSAACKGTAQLYPRTGGARPRAAAARPLATKRFSLRTAGRLRVAVPLGKRARSAVKRAGGARIVVSTQPVAGGRLQKRTVTVRAPR
jgi:hypothetical protein